MDFPFRGDAGQGLHVGRLSEQVHRQNDLVAGVTNLSTAAGSRLNVAGSMSAKTGRAPAA